MGIVCCGTGSAIPGKVLSNEDLSHMVDTSDEWIRSRTGISTRHILSENESFADLVAMSARNALEAGGISADELKLIICGTSTVDRTCPSCACRLQADIGATHAVCFDLSAGCSGFVYAMSVGESMLKSGYNHALIIGADVLSTHTDWSDRSTCVLFGDAAGAVLIKSDKASDRGILSSSLGSDGTRGDVLVCDYRADNPYIRMNGQEVYKFAIRTVPESIESSLKKAGISKSEVKFYILHQANTRILAAVAGRLGEAIDKFPSNLYKRGNTSAATIPVLLDELVREQKIVHGDIIVLSGFGAGLTWGSMVIRY